MLWRYAPACRCLLWWLNQRNGMADANGAAAGIQCAYNHARKRDMALNGGARRKKYLGDDISGSENQLWRR